MRDLPPPPPDVCRFELVWSVNGQFISNSWWIFAPGSDAATAPQIQTMLGDFFTGPVDELLPRVSTDTSVALLRCVTSPANGITLELSPAPNAGALDGTTALNAALVLTWLTGARSYGARTHSWLPLSRSNLGSDKRRLSPLGFAEGGAAALRFMVDVNAMSSPDGATCLLVGLHRVHNGLPMIASLMLPVQSAVASPIVGTLQRRTAGAPRTPSIP